MRPRPLLLYDGSCGLCQASVRWVLARDQQQLFQFASLQSDAGRAAMREAGIEGDVPDSMLLLDSAGAHWRSDAAIAVTGHLGMPWSMAKILRPLPRFLRDGVYRFVATHRHRWFGSTEVCSLPSPEHHDRFLDDTV